MIYLICTGAITEFINYAILGIRTFTNKIPYLLLLKSSKIEIRIFSILVPISIIIMLIILIKAKKQKSKSENIQNLLTIFIYSLSIIIVIYPISDAIHFLIGSLVSIIGIIYMLFILGEKKYSKIKCKEKYKIYKIGTLIIWLILFVIVFTIATNNIIIYLKKDKNIEINHYKNIEINNNLKQRIENINEYILEKEKEGEKVYVLDAEAAIYMIPLDKYNKNYDMFLKGNIGEKSEDGQIERIKQRDENEIFLIRKENLRSNWQTPLDVVKYIRNNLENIGEIEIYEIYK